MSAILLGEMARCGEVAVGFLGLTFRQNDHDLSLCREPLVCFAALVLAWLCDRVEFGELAIQLASDPASLPALPPAMHLCGWASHSPQAVHSA